MRTWYECAVKALKIDQGGYERKVTDNFLIDAVSYTDAETRIHELMPQKYKGDFSVKGIKPSLITEVIDKGGEYYFKAKINLVTIDDEAGKEKRVSNYLLVAADDLENAVYNLREGLNYMLLPYVIESVAVSKISEVVEYDLAKAAAKLKEG